MRALVTGDWALKLFVGAMSSKEYGGLFIRAILNYKAKCAGGIITPELKQFDPLEILFSRFGTFDTKLEKIKGLVVENGK